MLLVFDIGNTNITMGIFDGAELRATCRLATHINQMPDEYAVFILNLLRNRGVDTADITEGAISCVAPPLVTTFNELFQRYFNIMPLVVGPGVKTGIRIRYDNPRELGGDRISNAAGALSLYKAPVVGGAMGDISVILEGVDSEESRLSLHSTVHGAGRVMSRTQAAGKKRKGVRTGGAISREMMQEWVQKAGVELRGAGTDESPHCYKRLPEVLAHHSRTVRILHSLTPIGVAMAGENEFDPYKD